MARGSLPRALLEQLFPGQPRAIKAFEDQAAAVSDAQTAAGVAAEATKELQDATVLTLSPNESLTNERIFQVGSGLSLADDGSALTVSLSGVAMAIGGYGLTFVTTGESNIVVPQGGTMATLSNVETLANKTLAQPALSGVQDFADDTAAAGGGVQVGGVYRTGSTLKIRVA